MNKCCKSLLYKGLCLSKDLSFRLFPAKQNYSVLNQICFYFSFDNNLNSKPLFQVKNPSLLIHSHSNHLARSTKNKSSKSIEKKEKLTKFENKQENQDGIDYLFKPLNVKPILTFDKDNVGVQLGGKISKPQINEILSSFKQSEQLEELIKERGINARIFNESMISFRKFCIMSKTLPPELHLKFSDIAAKAANIMDLFPFYWKHINDMYPHLTCQEDLLKVSDLTEPSYWYIEAREIKRKIIYHCGPTNSGKTYSALQSFQKSESGIYCGPLKLLANEVFFKTNNANRACDLITGEERKFAISDQELANHIACTVEMANLDKDYDLAIIDEIQMIKDPQRGWAWTRALLGLKAKEIHLCGDPSAVDLISDLCFLTNDELKIVNYERLTSLNVEEKALGSLENVQPGDCFVCFNKKELFSIAQTLEKLGHEVAIIYGSMPPTIKLLQQKNFNDPNHPCKVLVATDAIGMGLNLNIRRIIFTSLFKQQTKSTVGQERAQESLNNNSDELTTSQALQIAGRAGRFRTQFPDGLVTTLNPEDLPRLKNILKQPLSKTLKAGLHPTAEQIELFAFHLPEHSLSSLLQIFMQMCKLDDGQYFLCNFDDQIFNAKQIDHLPIKIKSKYVFACSPIGRNNTFATTRLVYFARAFSVNEAITIEDLKTNLKWSSLTVPENMDLLIQLENIYDVLDLYLWLGCRFPSIFPYSEQVKLMRTELEEKIKKGVEKFLGKNNRSKQTKIPTNKHKIEYITEKSFNKPETKSMQENADFKLKNLLNSDLEKFNKIIQKQNSFTANSQETEKKMNMNDLENAKTNKAVNQESETEYNSNSVKKDNLPGSDEKDQDLKCQTEMPNTNNYTTSIKLNKTNPSNFEIETHSPQCKISANIHVENQNTPNEIMTNNSIDVKKINGDENKKVNLTESDKLSDKTSESESNSVDNNKKNQTEEIYLSSLENIRKSRSTRPESNNLKKKKFRVFDPEKDDPKNFLHNFCKASGYKKFVIETVSTADSMFLGKVSIDDNNSVTVYWSENAQKDSKSAEIAAVLNALNKLRLISGQQYETSEFRDFITGEDPVAYLKDLQKFKNWKKPIYERVTETKEPYVLIKVKINGTIYKPQRPSLNVNQAKKSAALECLRTLGYVND